jgi:hypothetical protein
LTVGRTLRRNMSPPSSRSKNKPSKNPAWSKQKAVRLDLQRTIRRYISDGRTNKCGGGGCGGGNRHNPSSSIHHMNCPESEAEFGWTLVFSPDFSLSIFLNKSRRLDLSSSPGRNTTSKGVHHVVLKITNGLPWSLWGVLKFRHYAKSRKVAGSSPDGVTFFNWPNPSCRTMALGSTQPLTEMSTMNLPGAKGRPTRKADMVICEPIV